MNKPVDYNKVILTERCLPMAGGYNFRDLGELQTEDGRYIKKSKIFRSDDLHKLTQSDLDYLESIPIISIVDFRSEGEMDSAPDKLPASVVNYYPYPINPGNLSSATGLSDLDGVDMENIMTQIYVMLVTEPASIERYKNFFRLLQNEENTPLLFHCSAGKDRTGMAAALVLFALGVDEGTIMQDYLLSNKCLGDKYAAYISLYPELKVLFEVNPAFLEAGINRIKTEHGSVETYLEQVLDVDIAKFRGMYLV